MSSPFPLRFPRKTALPLLRLRILPMVFGVTWMLSSISRAGTITFDGGAGGTGIDLDTAANWVGNALPVTTDEVLFDNSVLGTLPASLLNSSSNQTWGNLIWNTNDTSSISMTGSAGGRNLFLSGGGGSSAAIAAGGAAGDLILVGTNKTSGNFSISGTNGTGTSRLILNFSTSGNINVVNAGVNLNLFGQVSGLSAANSVLTKTGAGTLTFANGNTNLFNGTNPGKKFVLDGGTLNLTNNSGFSLANGTSTLEIRGGTSLDNTSGTAVILSANNPQSWNGDFTYKGTGSSLNTGTGTVTMSSSRTITVNANTLTVGGSIRDGGSNYGLTKSGAATLLLTGASTYGGATTVSGGTLQLGSGSDRLPIGTQLIVANGTSTATSGTVDLNNQNQTVAMLSTSVSGAGTTKGVIRNQGTGTATLTVTGTSTYDGLLTNGTLSSRILALTKSTGGTLTLTGANTYTGATLVSGGTLLINGSLAAGSAVSVNGGTLGGSGTVAGLVTVSGATSLLSPGNSPGTLTLSGGLNAAAGAGFLFELGTSSDLLNLGSGVLTGSAAANELVFDFADSGGLTAGTTYTLATFGSSSGLDYTDLLGNTMPAGFVLNSSFGTNGFQINPGNLQVQFAAVPEPSSNVFFILGLGLLGLLRRKTRR